MFVCMCVSAYSTSSCILSKFNIFFFFTLNFQENEKMAQNKFEKKKEIESLRINKLQVIL